ncbi:heterokaryon incompatibility protein-domain-containing protein [Xylariales sp. PMI_506]|nr:heterokaryon incompatibility protein-domain-containing protein [Xylariales sp. PMI_506]
MVIQRIHSVFGRPYVWGPPTATEPILINGQELLITPSLYVALRQLRYFTGNEIHPIWADGICINQGDKSELACQVPLMGQIYTQARCVYAWLGEEQDDSSVALKMLEEWGKTWDDLNRIKSNKRWPTSMEVLEKVENPADEREWAALEKLMDRAWWRRVWTTQEIARSTNALLICGNSWIQYARCSDPRDRVYGALGLFGNALPLDVSYGKTVSQFYLDFVSSAINHEKTLDILQYCGLKSFAVLQKKCLPTWASNLDARGNILKPIAIPVRHFDASAG